MPRKKSTWWNSKWQTIGQINFEMLYIWQAVPDSWTIIIKQYVRFQVGICPEEFQIDQIYSELFFKLIEWPIYGNGNVIVTV